MKKATSIIAVLYCAIIFFTAGCKKSSNTTPPPANQPLVTIVSPVEGTTYTGSLTMNFSVSSDIGLDSCTATLKYTAGGAYLYYNSFNSGADVRNKNSFTNTATQTALPTSLTDVQFVIRVVDKNKQVVEKTINAKVKQ